MYEKLFNTWFSSIFGFIFFFKPGVRLRWNCPYISQSVYSVSFHFEKLIQVLNWCNVTLNNCMSSSKLVALVTATEVLALVYIRNETPKLISQCPIVPFQLIRFSYRKQNFSAFSPSSLHLLLCRCFWQCWWTVSHLECRWRWVFLSYINLLEKETFLCVLVHHWRGSVVFLLARGSLMYSRSCCSGSLSGSWDPNKLSYTLSTELLQLGLSTSSFCFVLSNCRLISVSSLSSSNHDFTFSKVSTERDLFLNIESKKQEIIAFFSNVGEFIYLCFPR